MFKVTVLLVFMMSGFSDTVYGQIGLTSHDTDYGIEGRRLLQKIDNGMKVSLSENFLKTLEAIEFNLIAACLEGSEICGEEDDIDAVVKKNSASFYESRHLLDADLNSRSLQDGEIVSDFIMNTATAISISIVAMFDIINLLFVTPIATVLEMLSIIGDALRDIVNIDKGSQRLGVGLTTVIVDNIVTMSKLIEIEDTSEPEKRQLRQTVPEQANTAGEDNISTTDVSLSSQEKLTAVVRFAAYGYIVGGGDVLTSVQYSSAAHAYLSKKDKSARTP